MREILFRGKGMNGEWYEGDLYKETHEDPQKVNVIYKIQESNFGYADEDCWEHTYTSGFDEVVQPETIGQYTGLTDKNGKKIFEGDILEFPDRLVVVFWHTHLGCWDSNFLKFTNKEKGRVDMSPLNWDYKSKVIGNIHDNPELLGGDPNG